MLFAGVVPASAHASLSSTTPVADSVVDVVPEEVVLTFDAPVSLDLGGGVQVVGPGGTRVDIDDSHLGDGNTTVGVRIDDGGIGTYTVAWKTVSEDSHVLSGSFVFHVQQQTGAASLDDDARPTLTVLAWFARWLIVGSAALMGGIAVFRLAWLSRGDARDARTRFVIMLVAAAGVVGAVLRMLVQVAEASGRSLIGAFGLLGDAVATTRVGRLDAWRVGVFVVLLGAAIMWRQLVSALAVVAGVFFVATVNALSGHAWTADDRVLAVAADVVHQVASAIWLGGLVAVVLTLRRRPEEPNWFVRRFSSIALAAVAAIVVTGSVAAWQQVGSLSAIARSTYGRTLVVKTLFVAVMIAFGWWNRGRLRRSVDRAVEVATKVRVEAFVGLGVLAFTAALVGMVPAREVATTVAGPYSGVFTHSDGTVTVTLDPARVGGNTLHLYFFDADGTVHTVDAAEATVATGDVPPRRIDLIPIVPGHFSATSFSLPSPGVWSFTVTTLASGRPAEVQFEVTIT